MKGVKAKLSERRRASKKVHAQLVNLRDAYMGVMAENAGLKRSVALLERLCDQKKQIGWITGESIMRLYHGGNDSRGTVPIHQKESAATRYAVYIVKEPWMK